MSIDIRGIAPEEVPDLFRAVGSGFGGHINDRDLEIERRIIEADRVIAALDGEVFVGGSMPCTFTLSVPGATVDAAGITGVAVLPTHRRRGILTAMMRRLFEDLRDREAVSVLWASEGRIYGRFGYGMATMGAELSITRPHTPFRPGYRPAGDVRLIGHDEAMKLIPAVYDRELVRYPGFVRGSEAWTPYRFEIHDFREDGFGKRHFFAVHEGSEGPDGYLAYRIKTDWEGDESHVLKVEELMAGTPGAYADLWRFVFDVDLVEKVLAGARMPREPLLHLLADPYRMKVTLHDGLWVRLIRVEEALAARRYPAEGRLVLDVADELCPWNAGRYELVGGPDGAECRRTDAEPELRLTAEELGAVYLGGVSLRELARAGRIEASLGILERADAMLGWDPPPWCPFVF
jgi:predicted acetyltransferase